MPRSVGRLRPALHERHELVADIDERRARRAAAQAKLEQTAVEGQRAVEVAHLERDMVQTHELCGHGFPPSWKKMLLRSNVGERPGILPTDPIVTP